MLSPGASITTTPTNTPLGPSRTMTSPQTPQAISHLMSQELQQDYNPNVTAEDVIQMARKLYGCNKDDRDYASDELKRAGVENNHGVLLAILENSSDPHGCMYAGLSLVKWFRANRGKLCLQERERIINMVFEAALRIFHSAQGPSNRAQLLVLNPILGCLSRITKLTFDKEEDCVRIVTTRCLTMMKNRHSSQEVLFALNTLHALVSEVSLFDNGKSTTLLTFSQHRRCSNTFRDLSLLPIFIASIEQLALIDSMQCPNIAEIVRLVKDCLTFDFMAILVDETEDTLSAQYPTSWKDVLLSSNVQETLWRQHENLGYPHCLGLLQAIGGICGTRRAFFDSPEEKKKFLSFMLDKISSLESATDGRLQNAEYCCALAEASLRFIAPYGYRDLQSIGQPFENWLKFIDRFTAKIFSCPFGTSESFNTTTTLLKFWMKISISKRLYLGEETRVNDLEVVLPQLAFTFFSNRVCPSEFSEDDITEVIKLQSDMFYYICMFESRSVIDTLAMHLNTVGAKMAQQPSSMNIAGLAWMFYLSGSIFRGMYQSIAEEVVESYSAFLLAVINCAESTRVLLNNGTTEALFLENSLLFCLKAIQETFVSSRLTRNPTAVLTKVFQTKAKMFQFFLTSVGHNLNRTVNPENGGISETAIVKDSIDLIYQVCRDMPISILQEVSLELPPVIQLPISSNELTFKLRTNLYSALWSAKATGEYKVQFLLGFLAPIHELMIITMNNPSVQPIFTAGWLRDLRGVSRAVCSTQAVFSDFIDWIIEREGIFNNIAQTGNPPIVTISLLKFLVELVTPSTPYGKVNVPTVSHSAAGVILFKFICNIIQGVLSRSINDEMISRVANGGPADNAYSYMLKPIFLCMETMRKCITGDFVPFGAMALYNDTAYEETVVGMCRLLAVFPLHMFSQYTKATLAITDLFRAMVEGQVYSPLAAMSANDLLTMVEFTLALAGDVDTSSNTLIHSLSFLSFIAQMIKITRRLMDEAQDNNNNNNIMNSSLNNINNNSSHQHSSISPTPEQTEPVCAMSRNNRHIKEKIALVLQNVPEIWERLITVAMNIVTCQDRALSSCCQIVYPIFEADSVFWIKFSAGFVASYPLEKRSAAADALSKLGNAAVSQEKFFSEIFSFRAAIRKL